ncbi:MAG: cobalamin biosynthesis protein P47K [Planctomycetes bacterium]|nr:cobalamin biosynthesis protein P47K [Planctomycetota bacterium]
MPDLHRFIMVGGFLGAGKTTAMARLGRHFHSLGKRVGLITNDQAAGLVDTVNLRSQGFSVEEISGGCFCCRFSSLTEAADRLAASSRPEVFLSEPVGSCTDLIATVAIPLQRLYGNRFVLAPLTVLVDPFRARKILTNQARGGFSPKVAYIYRKQLEEADAIALNKVDLLDDPGRQELLALLQALYPGKTVFAFSARKAEGMQPWFDFVASEDGAWNRVIDLDYDLYADGEAELGWLNSAFRVSGHGDFDPNRILLDIARRLRERIGLAGAEIAHLKLVLLAEDGDTAVLSVVRGEAEGELSRSIPSLVHAAEITLNARTPLEPDRLRNLSVESVAAACQAQHLTVTWGLTQAFRPPRPQPEYRMGPRPATGRE